VTPSGTGRWRLLRRPGTAARLAAFHAVLLSAVLAVVVVETERGFAAHSLADTQRNLAAQMASFTSAAKLRPASEDLHAFSVSYLRTQVLPGGEAVVISLPGAGRLGSAGSAALLHSPAVLAMVAEPPGRSVSRRARIGATDTALLASPIEAGNVRAGTFVAAASLAQLHADERRVLFLAAGEAAIALFAGVAGAYLLLRRLLRTVGRITTTAAAIGAGEVDQRLGDQGTDDEVGQLAVTFDSMLDRLSLAMGAQRRLLSDISHQLRTPLTVARGHLEVLNRSSVEDWREVSDTVTLVVDELDHMRALVERLLLLGRSLEPDFLERGHIDLRSFLADLMEAARVLAPRRWSMPPVPDLVVHADPAKLRGALLNLIDNAVKATGQLDAIELAAVVRPGDGALVVSVDDSGLGIPADQRAAVLARFSRLGPIDKNGSGLGLAIVKAVAEAHGGQFELGSAELGGLRAAIILPARCVSTPVGQLERV
jgi:signal transduction histidine kinase